MDMFTGFCSHDGYAVDSFTIVTRYSPLVHTTQTTGSAFIRSNNCGSDYADETTQKHATPCHQFSSLVIRAMHFEAALFRSITPILLLAVE